MIKGPVLCQPLRWVPARSIRSRSLSGRINTAAIRRAGAGLVALRGELGGSHADGQWVVGGMTGWAATEAS